MHRVILHGSCRADGRSAALADELFNACIEECPEDGVSIVSVSRSAGPPQAGQVVATHSVADARGEEPFGESAAPRRSGKRTGMPSRS